jgi:hypothetical protein
MPRDPVAKILHPVERLRQPTETGQPGIEEHISEPIRQRIRQESGGTMERRRGQPWKRIEPAGQRHHYRRHLDTAIDKCLAIPKSRGGRLIFQRYRADGSPLQVNE